MRNHISIRTRCRARNVAATSRASFDDVSLNDALTVAPHREIFTYTEIFLYRHIPIQTYSYLDIILYRHILIQTYSYIDIFLYRNIPIQTNYYIDKFLYRHILITPHTIPLQNVTYMAYLSFVSKQKYVQCTYQTIHYSIYIQY